jgi:hypothetical protein
LKTIVAVSHICLAVFLVGCVRQERSARSRPSPLQASTNLYFGWGGTVTITKKGQEACIYVTGEVNHPDRIPWTNGLTLTKALELAAGFTDFASKSQVMLRRANGTMEQYSFVPPVADTVKNVKLDTGDMVHVTSRAWSGINWP